ncbi:MAG: transglutaminase domain-containing protein [Ruminococcaceae bacterium]|nr:transglutaminase domain-containing protein [Oscillospiraceae bacterium]
MKEKKIKKPKKQKGIDSCAIYNFPYHSGESKLFWAYPLKALLACITAAFGIMYVTQLLGFKDAPFISQVFGVEKGKYTFAMAAFIACAVYYALLGLFKGWRVAAVTLGGAALLGFWAYKAGSLAKNATAFVYAYLKQADGEFVHTQYYNAYVDHVRAENFMLLIAIAFGIIAAFATAKRFHPDLIVIFAAAMSVPAFLSRTACFYPSLVMFVAGLLGLWAMNQSMSANAILSTGGASNMRLADREYRKSIKELTPKARLYTEGNHYSMHFSDAVAITLIAAITMGIAANSFPLEGSIKFDKALQAVIAWGQGVGNKFSNMFADLNFKLGGNNYLNGYFSADGNDINLSNSINPNTADRDGFPVLEVTTEKRDKLYLRGDIFYEFDSDSWKSISQIDFSQLSYNSAEPEYVWDDLYFSEDKQIPITEVFENYVPELQTLYAKSLDSYNSYSSNSFIGMETVKIDYLKGMNTVLFPGTPFVYNFRRNDNFNVFGDFVAVSKGRKINSMETGVLYINEIRLDDGDIYDEYVFSQLDTDLTFEQYREYINAYDRFVNDYYTRISEKDERIIYSFAQRCLENSQAANWSGTEFKAFYCDEIVSYLNSGRYKYSLTADNFSGDADPIYNFLYNTREGHCAMYATAMCLALRYYGIPARYVTGFTLGGDDCEQTADGHYKYTVTDKELHAWVEVYYEGLGWVCYDPTPGSLRVDNTPVTTTTTTGPEPEETTTTTTTTTTQAPDETTTEEETQPNEADITTVTASTTEPEPQGPVIDPEVIRVILIVLGITVILFVIFMSVRGFLKGIDRKQREMLKFFEEGNATEAVRTMLPFMLRLLAIRGIVRVGGETPGEFGIRADSELEMESAVANTIPVFEKSEFDKEPTFNHEEQKTAYQSVVTVLNDTLGKMKAPKRLITRIKLFGKFGKHKKK